MRLYIKHPVVLYKNLEELVPSTQVMLTVLTVLYYKICSAAYSSACNMWTHLCMFCIIAECRWVSVFAHTSVLCVQRHGLFAFS